MKIVSYPEAETPPELRVQVIALQAEAWPVPDPSPPGPTHDPLLHPLSMLLVDSGRVVSALDILTKEISHAGQGYLASGLSTVVTGSADQRNGYGLTLVRAALATIETSGADLGIFTCDSPLRRFYERAGWNQLPDTVLVGGTPDAPFPSDQFDKVTMGRMFSARAIAHADDFLGARIDLYPGEIDKLW